MGGGDRVVQIGRPGHCEDGHEGFIEEQAASRLCRTSLVKKQ
jgi:hypothetical protein